MTPEPLPGRSAPSWRTLRHGEMRLLLADEIAEFAERLGLNRPWELVSPRPDGPGTGRGPCGIVRPVQGPALFIKRCLRGGLPARWNADRYFFTGRFRRELAVSCRARAAGLPVGETLAAMLRPGRPGWHAWTAARYIEDGIDLARALVQGGLAANGEELLRAAARAIVRIHDGGLRHPDLNLGNVVLRPCGPGAFEAFVVDLDRARWSGRPLSSAARRAARDRMARSWTKVFGQDPPLPRDVLDREFLQPVERGTA